MDSESCGLLGTTWATTVLEPSVATTTSKPSEATMALVGKHC